MEKPHVRRALTAAEQARTGRSSCFCGTEITCGSMADHVITAHRGIGA
jgi:hypothetical protein